MTIPLFCITGFICGVYLKKINNETNDFVYFAVDNIYCQML